MNEKYRHLSVEDRAVIMIERGSGVSMRSISRELKHNQARVVADCGSEQIAYDATAASAAYLGRRLRCGCRPKLVLGTRLYQMVYGRRVHWRWSPEQIAWRLRKMHPDGPTLQISHVAIYATIYADPRGALKKGMVEALRQRKHDRGQRCRTLAKGQTIPEAMRIADRPEVVQPRLVPGHREGDFIKGSFNRSGVGTVVERKTRWVVWCRMDGCTDEAMAEEIAAFSKRAALDS